MYALGAEQRDGLLMAYRGGEGGMNKSTCYGCKERHIRAYKFRVVLLDKYIFICLGYTDVLYSVHISKSI